MILITDSINRLATCAGSQVPTISILSLHRHRCRMATAFASKRLLEKYLCFGKRIVTGPGPYLFCWE